jgi:DNA repair exonuclease SbcCD ATPase subunit
MIHFKKVEWKNFLSTGQTPIEIDLDKSPTTLIIGKNGSGKSTLLDALCFALFNRPFRIIKKDQIVNSINDSDCEVKVSFSVGTKNYTVIRGIKPNKFEIYDGDTLVNQDASNVDYQKYLEQNIMKLNYRSFIQVVLLGSSSYEPFMKMKPRYRRDVVEEILDIKVFTQMDLILRSQQSELAKKVIEVRHSCDLIDSRYALQYEHYESLRRRTGEAEGRSRTKIEQNQEADRLYRLKLKEIDEKIAKHQAIVEQKPKVTKKVNELSKLEAKIENNLNNHKKTLSFFEEHDDCPVCTQNIPSELKDKKITEEKQTIDKLEKGLQELTGEIVKVESKVTEMDAVSKKIQDLNVEVAKINTSLSELKKHSDSISEDIETLDDGESSEQLEKELEQLKEDLKKAKSELTSVTEEKDYVDVVREILSDKGARANIIKKYLPIMNNLINKYLQDMDFFVSFHLDEEFNETVKSRNRDKFNYNNFSEGEKMRIDLALLFTWRSIAKLKNSTNTNLLILDEIFDSSLDGQGTEDFFKIIGALKNENVFIISHKGDILFDKFTNIVSFEKEHNFTRLQNV